MIKKEKKNIEKISIKNNWIIAETIYDYRKNESSFLAKDLTTNKITEEKLIEINNRKYIPFSNKNKLLNKKILTLPSGILDYKNKENLINEIIDFIHNYVDLSESFERVSGYYVLMTWIYDIFDNVGYLRVRGNPGSGKSRFLDVMNAITYKSTFFRVNPTEAVIFRALDDTRGTMIIDEADYNNTGKTSNIVKLLNNGFAKKSSITRNKAKRDGGYELETFEIFSPKIIANRDYFKDDALESRCFTEYMGRKKPREEVLIKLDKDFEQKAEKLRNKLLKFRLDNLDSIKALDAKDLDMNISARSKQIAVPIASIMLKEDLIHLEKILQNTENNLKHIRNDYLETDILNIILEKIKNHKKIISIKEITVELNKNSQNWEKISNRKVGSILSNMNIVKTRGGKKGNFIISISENKQQLKFLFNYYDIK